MSVVYLLSPTSNHNIGLTLPYFTTVVYLLSPTSNHNCDEHTHKFWWLYIF